MASKTLTGKHFVRVPELIVVNVLSITASDAADNNSKPLVIVEKLNDITTIGINRPEKRNCVNHATAKKLMEAFAEFEADKNARV